MTTIAYRDGIMACDSCWSLNGSLVDTLSDKVYRLKSGALLGQCGSNDIRPMIKLLENAKSERQMPSYNDIAAIRISGMYLLVLPNKRIFKFQTTSQAPETWTDDLVDLGMWRVERPFTAVGSGADYAIGAMEAGAGAVKAVRISCRLDINSRLPIHTHKLHG